MWVNRVGQWLGIAANLGVVAGFVLLAMQMDQNTKALRNQNAMGTNQTGSNVELAAMGDTGYEAMARAMLRPTEMTDEQILQFWYYVDNVLAGIYNLWIAHRAGLATESEWIEARNSYSYMLDFDAARIVWDRYKMHAFPAAFIEDFDAALQQRNRGSADASVTFQEIIDDIRRLPGDGTASAPSGERSDAQANVRH
jgi:hypothetical protein